jgi:DmsE family decaheme c-type cytochrome
MRRAADVIGAVLLAIALALYATGALAGGPAATASPKAAPAAQATPAAAQKPPTYVGSEACKACHAEQVHDFMATMMGKTLMLHARDERERLGCETCHGPGSQYVTDMAAAMGKGIKAGPWHGPSEHGLITFRKDSGESAKTDNGVCLTCHEKGEQAFWRASVHAFRGVRCTDCHLIMRKVSPRFQLAAARRVNPFIVTRPETEVCLNCHPRKRMQMNLPSHMPLREGSMVCTDCHNPHGGPYPDQLRQATVNQTCYTCHAEKRGPFLWIHPPVMQNCLNCHDPHGSVNRFLLKVREPRLCQQCHVATFHPGTPAGAGSVFVFSRSCTNCHSNIHGSNAPGGRLFTR